MSIEMQFWLVGLLGLATGMFLGFLAGMSCGR